MQMPHRVAGPAVVARKLAQLGLHRKGEAAQRVARHGVHLAQDVPLRPLCQGHHAPVRQQRLREGRMCTVLPELGNLAPVQ